MVKGHMMTKMKTSYWSNLPFELMLTFLPILMLSISSCSQDYSPKPPGYHRIEIPETSYIKYESYCPFSFDMSKSAEIKIERSNGDEFCWFDVYYPSLKAEFNLSYKNLNSIQDLQKFSEDTYRLTYKHSYKASSISEAVINLKAQHTWGLLYEVAGNAASPFQFYLTDSNLHFVRGSVYFNCEPNVDSLAPAIDFMKQELLQMINSWNWK